MISIKGFLLLLLTTFFFVGCKEEPEQVIIPTAKYKVTFQAFWSEETHSNEFPTGPHFSGVIGLTHKGENILFTPGLLATEGIKVMSEIGAKTPLEEEIETYISNGNGDQLISGGGISRSPGMVSVEFTIHSEFPLVTIVSMLAPSPDWFVAVENVALVDKNVWVKQKVVPVVMYDAGTDAGITYQSSNQIENPYKNIEQISSPPLAQNGILPSVGEFTFELIE